MLTQSPDPGTGMRAQPTTQTAVNNFLGLHRFDAVFQILVGSWVSPLHHGYFANGNVLAWADLLPYKNDKNMVKIVKKIYFYLPNWRSASR